MSVGANPKDIIYANPAKGFKHLEYAKEQNVKKMTFDNKEELGKIQKAYPEAELVLRIAANDSKVCHCEGFEKELELSNVIIFSSTCILFFNLFTFISLSCLLATNLDPHSPMLSN